MRGGCSPQSASISRSVETARPASSRSSARRARCFGPPSSTGRSLATDLERAQQPELQAVAAAARAAVGFSRKAPPCAGASRAVLRCQRLEHGPLASRWRAVTGRFGPRLDGGRMATNTHIPVRSARRCIVRPAVSKFFFVTAAAIATSSALAFCWSAERRPGAREGDLAGREPRPSRARATAIRSSPSTASTSSARTSAIRACSSTGLRPWTRSCTGPAASRSTRASTSPPPTARPSIPVVDGTVTVVTHEWVRVTSGDGRAFEYWHIRPLVRNGQQVTARQTVLGHIRAPSNHVHLTEYEGGRVVNPLVPGRLTPYHDSSKPTVRAIMLRRTDSGPELLPNFVRGRVEIVVGRRRQPDRAGPVRVARPCDARAPHLADPQHRRPGRRAAASRRRLSHLGASGTRPSGACTPAGRTRTRRSSETHYSYLQRGAYLFKLAQQFDTRTLRDGVYDLIVKASDIRGNSSSQTLRFTVHNRRGWSA